MKYDDFNNGMSLRGARQGDAAIFFLKNEIASPQLLLSQESAGARNDVIVKKEGLTMRRKIASLLSAFFVMLTSVSLCMAANYDFKDVTPEIEKALKNRQARYYQLQALKQEGVIGENNKGYVTDLKDNTTASTMVAAENKDRRVLYEALAEQNKLGNTGLLEIQKAFAEVQKEKAVAGDMVQSPAGDWKKKSS